VSIILPVFRFDRAVPIFSLLLVVLVGCSSPTPQEKMQDAQHDLVSEAMDVQRCESANGYASEKCASQRKAYEDDLARFRATYGK
jgi:hypothetical protein